MFAAAIEHEGKKSLQQKYLRVFHPDVWTPYGQTNVDKATFISKVLGGSLDGDRSSGLQA